MQFAGNVFDVWAFRRRPEGIVFLLLYTSVRKAARHFSGGRFWQIPSGAVNDGETMTDAIRRVLALYDVHAKAIWAAEHAYVIYNRRFDEMQAIAVFAAEVLESEVTLMPSEHAEYGWFTFEECLARVHYRGLKDGLRSVRDYVTGVKSPAMELCLYVAPPG
jgi:8-oxo-dGTP pyrophosphatase MutT (NUDIX family)